MNRNNRRRNYEKSAWEIERENLERLQREKDEAAARAMENTEENFPTLGKSVAKPVTWNGKKFTELASEWKADTDEQKIRAQHAKILSEQNTTDDGFVMPKFDLTRHYAENVTQQQSSSEEKSTDSTWTTVNNSMKTQARLARKQRRIDEKIDRADDGEEIESESDHDENDDSCWGVQVAPAGKSFIS